MERSRCAGRVAALLLCAGQLLLTPAAFAEGGAARSPHNMPPHPRLRELIQSGELRVPSVAINSGAIASSQASRAPLSGSLKMLAVLVDFSDKVHTATPTYFDSLLFAAPVAGRGSVRDYYSEISYGQVDIVTVDLPSKLDWQRAPQTLAYYVSGGNYGTGTYPNNCQKLAEDVVDALNGVVDFAQYDNNGDGTMEPIVLIHAGRGAEYTGSSADIWSHSWYLNSARTINGVTISRYIIQPEYWQSVSTSTSDMTIGVFAHEMGHGFWNLPDLYDTDGSSEGVGNWDLMGGGSWNGPSGLGGSPAWPSAWTRRQMGFATSADVTTNASQSIAQPYGASQPAGAIARLSSSGLAANEYFLVENRGKIAGTYDEYLPGSGLLIWHIDEAMTVNRFECTAVPQSGCSDTQHPLVKLEEADGLFNLELANNRGDAGDPFPGTSSNRSWTNTTAPESSSYYAAGDTCIKVTSISDPGTSMTADLSVTCGTSNRPPVANNDTYATDQDTTLTVPAPGVLANDTDPDGDALTAVLAVGVAHGALTLNSDGSFSYAPTAGYTGTDNFTYRASDGKTTSDLATVTITVKSVNDAPVAVNDAYSTNQNAPLNVAAPGVLANDSDADGNALTAVLVTGVAHGTLVLNADGSFGYTPTAGYAGSDSFTYKANDGLLDSNVATVAITVYSVNHAPVAVNDAYSTSQNTPLNVAAPGVLANDSDADGNALTAVLVTGVAHGTLVLNADGSFGYTPTAGYAGSDSFTYKANDGLLDSNVATVTLSVGAPSTGRITVATAKCSDFAAGTAPDVTDVLYGVRSGRISSLSPSAFIYYASVTAPASTFQVRVAQSNSGGWPAIGLSGNGWALYDSGCTRINARGTLSVSSVTFNVVGATPGATYYFGVQYAPSSLWGKGVMSPYPSVPYTFTTALNGAVIPGATDSVNVKPK